MYTCAMLYLETSIYLLELHIKTFAGNIYYIRTHNLQTRGITKYDVKTSAM